MEATEEVVEKEKGEEEVEREVAEMEDDVDIEKDEVKIGREELDDVEAERVKGEEEEKVVIV